MAKKPTNAPPPEDDDDEPEFTPRQLELMGNTINAAVSAQIARKIKPIQDQLGVLPSIQETLEKLAGGAGGGDRQQQQGGAGGDKTQPPPLKIEEHPEFVALRKKTQTIEQEREQERGRARNATRDSKLVEIATAAGVDKHRMRGAVALLRESVKFDKDGNPTMTAKRDGYDEDVTLETGAKEFFATDEGKSYLAPTQQQVRGGTGTRQQTNASTVARGGSNAAAKNRDESKQEKKQEAASALVGAIGELLGGGNITVG